MFKGFKNPFGNIDISAMLGPMLPGIMKDAAPKLVQAFDDKVLELENDLEQPLDSEPEWIEEIVAFVSKRNNQLQIDWVVLRHEKVDEDNWLVEITETIETITMQDFMAAAMEGLTNAPAPVKELPAEPKRLHEISETVQKAPIDPKVFQELPEIEQRHEKYKNERFVVHVGEDNLFKVVEGPIVGQAIWYGHQDETIAQNWADVKNRELKNE